jgi:hypothetical protein
MNIDAMPELPRRFPEIHDCWRWRLSGISTCEKELAGLKMEGFLAHRNYQGVEMRQESETQKPSSGDRRLKSSNSKNLAR